MPYERSLISRQLGNETFSEDEKKFIKSIIYPSRNESFYVDDAFGIFIGYEMKIDDIDKKLPNSEFRNKIKLQIIKEVKSRFDHISNKIEEYNLFGHNFYIYFLPITNLNESRLQIQQEITK